MSTTVIGNPTRGETHKLSLSRIFAGFLLLSGCDYTRPNVSIPVPQHLIGDRSTWMTSTTRAAVTTGPLLSPLRPDGSAQTPYRLQRIAVAFNHYEGTLDPNTGLSLDGTSALAIATNDQHGVGRWNVTRIPVAGISFLSSITGNADIASMAWSRRIETGTIPPAQLAVVAEGYRLDGQAAVTRSSQIVYVRSTNGADSWQQPAIFPPMTDVNHTYALSRPTVAIEESYSTPPSDRRTSVAFIGNRGTSTAVIGLTEARTDDAEWRFSPSFPVIQQFVDNDAVKDTLIHQSIERLILRANPQTGTYLAVDTQVVKPASDVDSPGDGYCFPLLFRYDRRVAAGDFQLQLNWVDEGFNQRMLNWTPGDRMTGVFRCHREITIGNERLHTSHIDFAVDQPFGLLQPIPGPGGVRNPRFTFTPFDSRRFHLVLAAIPTAPPSDTDEVLYFNANVTRLVADLSQPTRHEQFEKFALQLSRASASGARAFQPSVTAIGGAVSVTWYQQDLQQPDRIVMLGRRSPDNGQTWGPIVDITAPANPVPSQSSICLPLRTQQRPPDELLPWSNFTGSVSLAELSVLFNPNTPPRNGLPEFPLGVWDPLAVTFFTGGSASQCANASPNGVLDQEVQAAGWR